ncbi:MAG TPA: hypothetical protein DIW43_13015 [Spongiibacteraceae bacterium]|nr:hypothetical protein [Spongiibacteraceae bacterium]HCS28372.1 hypothetical protein [Spongiibacteraceae bacterium]
MIDALRVRIGLTPGDTGKHLSKFILVGMLVGSKQGYTQEQSTEKLLGLEEVVVTARRVEEGLQSTPVAVTAVTSHEMEVRNMTDVRDLARATPNLILQTSAANGGSQVPAIYLRGLGQSDVTLTADPAVGMYLDGVYIARNSGNVLSLLELERVEVLRGPQGTLFGKNTIGGAISLVSKKPGPEFDLKGEITIGNYNLRGEKISVNTPITDNFYIQTVVAHSKKDGYVDLVHYPGKSLGDSESIAARMQMRWLPSDAVTIDFAADYSLIEDVGPPTVLVKTYPGASGPTIHNALISGNPLCNIAQGQETQAECYGPVHESSDPFESRALWTDRHANKVDPYNDFEILGANLTVSWDFMFGSVKSISSYRELNSAFNFEGDRSPAMVDGGDAKQQDADQYSQEIQILGESFDDRLSWLVGLYYFEEDSLSRVEVYSPFAILINPTEYPLLTDNYQPQKTTNQAAFGQATWDFNEWLHLTGGLRWTREEKESTLILLPSTPEGLHGENNIEEWTPMVSVNVDIADGVMTYLSYSEGFRSGGFPPRVIGQVSEIPSFGPEKAKTYELGLKGEFFDRRLRTNAAIFTNDYTDFQAAGTDNTLNPPLATVINAGDARVQGAELEVEAILTSSIKIDGGLSYLDTELSNVDPTANEQGVPVTDGDELAYTPAWKASLGVTWRKQFETAGEVVVRVDAAYTDEMNFGLTGQPESNTPDLTTYNAAITYYSPDGHWEAAVGGKNLRDEYYFTSSFASKNSGGNWKGVVAEPRTYFASIRWRY